jgi:broad specificity phosphatase PhoE
MKITLIRHGEMKGDPFIEPAPGVSGSLSELGIQQAEETAEILKDWNFTHAFSSSFGRALQTAEAVMKPHDLNIRILPFMHEWMPDRSLENIPSTKAEDIQKQVSELYQDDTWKTPLGEGTLEIAQRIGPPFLEVLREFGITQRHGGYFIPEEVEDMHWVVFAHGGSHGTLSKFLLGLPINNFGLVSFQHTGVMTIAFTPSKERIYYPCILIPSLHELPS